MESVIFVLFVVLVAYVAADRTFRVRRLPFVLSIFFLYGIEFILLGVIAGPEVFGWLDAQALDSLWSPFALALAWAGMLFGLQFRLQNLRKIAAVNHRIATVQSVVVFIMAAILFLPLKSATGAIFLTFRESMAAVFAIAAIAAISAPTIVASVARRYKAHGSETRLLYYVAAFDAAVGIILFGIALSFFRAEGMAEGALVRGTAWLLITVGVGVLLGFLYHVFMALKLTANERLAMAVGMLVLAAGAASLLDVSPLFLSFVIGVVLANFADRQDKLFRLLAAAERPLFGFMLIVAAARWKVFDPTCILVGAWFVVIRTMSKIVGTKTAFAISGAGSRRARFFGLALMGQGGLAIAMALDFARRYPGPGADLLIGSMLVAFVINGALAPYMVRGFLKEEGEIA